MQLILFISGIGVLLLAMQQLESALASLASEHLKTGLQFFTKTPVHGIILGLVATAILQSSSVVGLMTMAFVGAGMMKLKSAIGVVLGSNLGTTVTGWIVAFLGFKLNLTELYIPFLGLGAMGMVLLKPGSKNHNLTQFSFAFGFLLLGLSLMKDSISFIIEYVDISSLQNYSLFLYFIFGAVLTALIQSSSATMMITLSALSAGIIEVDSAGALIIGADLGTTSTVILGSINGSIIKRQVALVHFIFNLAIDGIAMLCLPLLLALVTTVFLIADPLFALVAIHSSFNLVGIFVFFPFIKTLQNFVEARFPEPDKQALFISMVSNEVPSAALHALEKDTNNLLQTSIILNLRRLGVVAQLRSQNEMIMSDPVETVYVELKHQENKLSDYILDLQRQSLSQEEINRSQQLLVCIRDTLYASKAIKDICRDLDVFQQSTVPKIRSVLAPLLKSTEILYESILAALDEPESFSISQLGMSIESVKTAHTDCNSRIYELIDNKNLKKENASTALNINREILLSGHSFINALEHFLLPGDQAKTVSELLNMRF